MSESDTEVLYGRSSSLRVFISSEMRSGRLRTARNAAASVVDKHPDAEPWRWETHARAGRYSAYDVCVNTAKTSDILLLILAEDLTEVTEAEWRAAKLGGANCALLLKSKVRLTPRAQAFIDAERHDCIYVEFADLRALRVVVADALGQCMTDAVRQRAVRRRSQGPGDSSTRAHLLEAGIERAERLYHEGAIRDARGVIHELEAFFDATGDLPGDLDLVTGLVEGAAGQASRAADAYLRVIRNPGASRHTKAVAHQNLGIEAMRVGQLRMAAQYMKSAFRLHVAEDDWFGVLQVVLNSGNLALERGDCEAAAVLADVAEEIRLAFGEPLHHQRASIIALRALIAGEDGRHDEVVAAHKKTYAISQRLGDLDGQLVSCQNVAASYRELGRTVLARRWVEKALSLAEGQGATWRREELHRLAALIACDARDFGRARQHFESARALAGEMGDAWRVATVTADIGAALAELDSEDAPNELDRAERLLTELDEPDWLRRVHMNRSLFASRREQTDEAVRWLETAATIHKGDRSARVRVHERLARLHLDAGRAIDATREFRRALSLQPMTAEGALAAGIYAHELEEAQENRQALTLFDLAVRRASKSDDEAVAYDVLSDRAVLLAATGHPERAMNDFESCLATAERLKDPDRIARALHNIGELARRIDDIPKSRKALKRACTVARRSGDEAAYRSALASLAITYMQVKGLAAAERAGTDLLELSRSARDRQNEATALGVLAWVAFGRSEYELAADRFRAAARLNASEPVHLVEDLGGLVQSHAAAGRWRPTVRAVQALVDHAQGHHLEHIAWQSLSHAARCFIDRGELRRAATITMPAWVLASQSQIAESRRSHRRERDILRDSELMDALLTTALHELWSEQECSELYDETMRQLGLEDGATGFRRLIEEARSTAANLDAE